MAQPRTRTSTPWLQASFWGALAPWMEQVDGASAASRAILERMARGPTTLLEQYQAVTDGFAAAGGLGSMALARQALWRSGWVEATLDIAMADASTIDATIQASWPATLRALGVPDSVGARAAALQVLAEAFVELDGQAGADPLFGSWVDLAGRYDVSGAILSALGTSSPQATAMVPASAPSPSSGEGAGAAVLSLLALAGLTWRARRR